MVDLVQIAVINRPAVVPGAKNSLDSSFELLVRILRKRLALFRFNQCLVLIDQLLEVLSSQLRIRLHGKLLFHVVQKILKMILVDFQNHVAVHLNEPPIAVPGKTRVTGSL